MSGKKNKSRDNSASSIYQYLMSVPQQIINYAFKRGYYDGKGVFGQTASTLKDREPFKTASDISFEHHSCIVLVLSKLKLTTKRRMHYCTSDIKIILAFMNENIMYLQ